MKLITLLIFSFLTFCAFGQTLNSFIIKAQKKAISNSPYLDAKGFSLSKYQTQFRLTEFPKTISNILFNRTPLTDTLWIVETFDDMCPSCPSHYSNLLYKDSLYTYNILSSNNNRNKFTVTQFDNKPSSFNYIIMEVVDSVRRKRNWLSNPLHYGSNLCSDGDHTLVTIIYPDKHIESLYARCWTEPEYRAEQ